MWQLRFLADRIPTFRVANTIGTGTTVRGDLAGPGGFRVDGAVTGSVEAEGPVVVGEGGTIDGSVRGSHVVVLGKVRGDVTAAGHLEIGPNGKVIGDISVQSFKMHKGGVFRGTSRMPAAGEEALTTTNPFGMLPPTIDLAARGGRTLPPPTGAVPPPPPESGLVASEERLIVPLATGTKDIANG
jgi:cytoskeletal protein CcmA (bactofilin family)